MIHIVATYVGPQSPVNHDALIDSLRQTGRECGGLEHARVYASNASIRGVLFIGGMESGAAQMYCREIFEQTVISSPKLSGWTLSHCDFLPMT
ncbi:hypothetical protein [Streptomyces sp. IB2014 016-6]|uniref:hypothetical protein n=1 Tax=Streptomyces sp. IB2014 016-6 TaxID=2517818 RepID=UPI0011CCC5DC|nr:hypothetical protein [Streptomyces sp. IB2014 016-6]TXL87716.1 hypothetical protein EW053_22645 [Streptomyces sp. IB2014 016-6]